MEKTAPECGCVSGTARNIYFVLNKKAGKGLSKGGIESVGEGISLYETRGTLDARRYVADVLRADPSAHIVACGGDGTISEAVGGILDAGAGESALLSAIGTGSGNDFVRYINSALTEGEIRPIDVVAVGDRYSVNMINIGFDCTVVAETDRLKKLPFVGGSAAYILGVVKSLVAKKTLTAEITIHGVDGTDRSETVRGEFLLTAAAECPYCGGGFKAAPTADPSDGLVDMLIVNDMPRRRFIGLVGCYRSGTHFTESGELAEKFSSIITHVRCRSFEMSGVGRICVDGEVIPADYVHAQVLRHAIRYSLPRVEWVRALHA